MSAAAVPSEASPVPEAPLMLSVSGARGIVGQTMTPAIASELAAAFGSFVRAQRDATAPVVCVGRDSRPSGEMLAAAAMAGLVAVGCRVIDLGVVPTPTVGVMIGRHAADGGLVVTASHNPLPWNGLKFLDAQGIAPPKPVAEEIIRRFRDRRIDYAPADALAPVERDDGALRAHVERVLAAVDPRPIRAAGFTVVLDSVNGAGAAAGRMLLEALGAKVVQLNGEPTGRFAHGPEPIRENLAELCARVPAESAACGFAQDPDADRLAIADENGRYVGEEYTLALAARRVLEIRGGGALAANLSTSRMIDDLAARWMGSTVRRTAVGEANVAEAMHAAGAVIGGEGNGGVIFPPVCWVRDSLSAMALVLDLLAAERRPLSAIVEEMPAYCMIKRKLDLAEVGGAEAAAAAMTRVAAAFAGAEINALDGVRIDLPIGWVHLRPSNTEPIVRLIAEARTVEEAEALVDEVVRAGGL